LSKDKVSEFTLLPGRAAAGSVMPRTAEVPAAHRLQSRISNGLFQAGNWIIASISFQGVDCHPVSRKKSASHRPSGEALQLQAGALSAG
jgi:hypothetical protein